MPKVLRKHEQVSAQRWCPEPLLMNGTVADPRRQAEEMVAAAQQQVDVILCAAQAEADRIRETAFAQGLAEGRLTGEGSYTGACDAAEQLKTEIEVEREAFFERIEPELVRLAVSIAEKIIARQLSIHPELIIDITRVHLQQLRERERVKARIHPEDLPLLSAAAESLLLEVDGVKDIQFIDDARLQRGDVILESPAGTLDARLATKLAVISTGLDQVLEGANDGAVN